MRPDRMRIIRYYKKKGEWYDFQRFSIDRMTGELSFYNVTVSNPPWTN